MINTQDQEQLFRLIADYLEKDISCIAIGGTAMMFAGYKTATKDIDLVFSKEADRKAFVKAIEQLGYKQHALMHIYDEQRKQHPAKPQMYTRGDERFDLFVNTVFGYKLSWNQEVMTERHDFIGRKELVVYVVSKEELILLKAITGRERDYEDITDIVKIEKDIMWDMIIDKAINQARANPWLLVDLESALQKLKNIAFIPQKHFERIYKAQKRA